MAFLVMRHNVEAPQTKRYRFQKSWQLSEDRHLHG